MPAADRWLITAPGPASFRATRSEKRHVGGVPGNARLRRPIRSTRSRSTHRCICTGETPRASAWARETTPSWLLASSVSARKSGCIDPKCATRSDDRKPVEQVGCRITMADMKADLLDRRRPLEPCGGWGDGVADGAAEEPGQLGFVTQSGDVGRDGLSERRAAHGEVGSGPGVG